MSFQKVGGWVTPYSHFLYFLAGGDEDQLSQIYRAAIAVKSVQDGDQRIGIFFESTLSFTTREKVMYLYLDLILSLSLSVTYVQNDKFS